MATITIDLVPYQDDARNPLVNPKLPGESDIEYENRLNDLASAAAANALYYFNQNGVLPPIQRYPSPVSGVANSASTSTGTAIDKINSNLVHECAQGLYVRKAVEFATGLARSIIIAIRNAITATLKALGFNPAVGGFTAVIKAIANLIDDVTYYINKINDFIENVAKVIAQIRAIIDYILSLPAELLRLFRECLQQAYAELQRSIFQAISGITDEASSGFDTESISKLLQSSRDLSQATNKLLQAPNTLITAAGSQSSLTSSEKNSLLSGLFPGYTEYDKNSYGLP